MSARIIQLSEARAQRIGRTYNSTTPPVSIDPALRERFCFWAGASGSCYVHTVYTLVECPEVAACNYVLARRGTDGRIEPVVIGRLDDHCGSLNLAALRQQGAQLGANEVHIHMLASTPNEMKLIEFDLKSGQQGSDAASATRH